MKHSIGINKTAHYYTLGENKAKTIWFVLHGYGYLAKHFIKKFEPILDKHTLVIAPEALSKFYLNGVGKDGRVGASWMTKENRADEITDYVNYLNQLYATVLKDNSSAKINIVGFSQGGATACRWIANGKIKCDNFILWASVFPEDMSFEKIMDVNTFFLYGDNDKYVTEERIATQKAIFKQAGINIKTTIFKGKHDVPKSVLLAQTLINNW